ncbi:MAG: hypothetical protein KR126chlam1_01343 [Chlamydiae bacterium]|nr:hypothetical protein [Chlamydiota bacterium]
MTKKFLLVIVSLFCVASMEGSLSLEEIFSESRLQSRESSLPIRPLLDLFERPFTLLELKPQKTKNCEKIARDYQCAYVSLGKQETLLPLTEISEVADQLTILKADPTADRLINLSECEHFDIVLADSLSFSFVKANLKRLLELGDYLVFTVPSHLKEKAFRKHFGALQEKNFLFLMRDEKGITPFYFDDQRAFETSNGSELLCVVHTPKKKLIRNHYLNARFREYFIESSFEEKTLTKERGHSHWCPGINLCTYKMLEGVYPNAEQIREGLLTTRYIDHPDLAPYNVVLNGAEPILIDWTPCRNCGFDQERGMRHDPEKGLVWIFYLLEITSPSFFFAHITEDDLVLPFIGW